MSHHYHHRSVRCWSCGLSLSKGQYTIKHRKAILTFLLTHPQWQRHGHEFTDTSELCTRKKCMAISYESWRLDTFGIKSPRSPRTSLSPERRLPESPAEEEEEDEYPVEGSLDATFVLASPESKAAGDQQQRGDAASSGSGGDQEEKEKEERSGPFPPPLGASRRVTKSPRQPQQPIAAPSEQYEKVIAERRTLVSNITSRGSVLDVAAQEMSVKLQQNREERLRVAKRIDQMAISGGDRERRQRELQKELALLKKRDLYEQMLSMKIAHEETQQKIDEIEQHQQLAITRMEEAARKKQEHQEAVLNDDSGVRKNAIEQLAPVLQFMKHIPETEEIIRGNPKYLSSQDESSGAVTKALQLALRESYIRQKESILEKRRELTAGRFELEERLEELRAQLPPSAIVAEDEPFDAAFHLAETMTDYVDHTIAKLNQRVVKAAEELEWLEEAPDTDLWYDIQARMEQSAPEAIDQSNAVLSNFYNGVAECQAFAVTEKNVRDIDQGAKRVAEAIIEDFTRDLVRKVCEDLLAVVAVCQVTLDQALLRAITGADAQDVDLMRISGREFLYMGALNDLRLTYYRDHVVEPPRLESLLLASEGVLPQEYHIKPTQPLVDGRKRAPTISSRSEVETTEGVLLATTQIDDNKWTNDYIKRQPVADAEQAHWAKFSLSVARGSPLLLPNVPGHTCCIRLFPHAVSMSSLLVVGTDQGQLAVYMVPWTGNAATLLSITPQLPRKLKSPVIDVREASTSPLQLLSVTKNGHVRVWSLAAVPSSNKNHSPRMFPRDPKKFETLVPACLFHISPLDMSMPVPLDPTGRATAAAATALSRQAANNTKSEKRRRKNIERKTALGQTAFPEEKPGFFGGGRDKLRPQAEMFPSSAAFHPSLTLLGRNPSILVGTQGGDLVKFNMDFKVDALDAPIAFLPAFLNLEFVHPLNSPESVLQTSSGRKGNQVYRELFHFHKSRVLLISVVNRLSDAIFTMDENLAVALWRYDSASFHGMCWFKPIATAQLDLALKANTYVGDTASNFSEPTAAQLEGMRVRSRYYDATGSVIEIYSPLRVGRQLVEFQSRTATYTTATVRPANPGPGPGAGAGAGAGATQSPRGGSSSSTPPARASPPRSPPPGLAPAPAAAAGDSKAGAAAAAAAAAGAGVEGETVLLEEVTEVSWTSRYVREVVMQTRVEATSLSADGTEMAFVVSYRKAPDTVSGAGGFESIPLSAYKSYLSVISFHLETLDYQRPFPVMEIDQRDTFLSFSLSPILSETLTRACLVHTRLTGLRVFSMETGEEIRSPAFPFMPKLPSFEPSLCSACPSLRVVAFGGPQDARIAVYVFLHEDDGKDEEELKANQLLTPDVLAALRRDYTLLEPISTRTVLAAPIEIDPPEIKAAKEAIGVIINEIFDAVMDNIEAHIIATRKKGFINEVYGSSTGLGRVRPNAWLGDAAKSVAAQEESDEEERETLELYNDGKRREESKELAELALLEAKEAVDKAYAARADKAANAAKAAASLFAEELRGGRGAIEAGQGQGGSDSSSVDSVKTS